MRLIILFVLTTVVTVQAQSGIDWQVCLGGEGYDEPIEVKPTSDGGFIAINEVSTGGGQVTGFHVGGTYNTDAWVVKVDSTHNLQWQRCFGGTGSDQAKSVQPTADGGCIVGIITYSHDGDASDNHGESDALVVKLDADGDVEWKHCYGSSQYDWLTSISQTTDGGFVFAGSAGANDGDVSGLHNPDSLKYDAWVVKLDPQGGIVWQRCYGGSREEMFEHIIELPDGNLIACGWTATANNGDVSGDHVSAYSDEDVWIVKLGSTGDIIWQHCYGGTNFDGAYYIKQLVDGTGLIFYGQAYFSDGDVDGGCTGNWNLWIVKIDNFGNISAQTCKTGVGDSRFAIDNSEDLSYILFDGSCYPSDTPTISHCTEGYLIKYNSNAAQLWQYSFTLWEIGNLHALQTTDGGYIVYGHARGNGDMPFISHGHTDIWIAKLSASVGIEGIDTSMNSRVYPNPVADVLHYQVTGAVGAVVVYDVCGKKASLPPTQNNSVDVSNLMPGVYVVEIVTKAERYRQRFVKT